MKRKINHLEVEDFTCSNKYRKVEKLQDFADVIITATESGSSYHKRSDCLSLSLKLKLRELITIKISDGTESFVKIPLNFKRFLDRVPNNPNLAIAGGFLINIIRNDIKAITKGDIDFWMFGYSKDTNTNNRLEYAQTVRSIIDLFKVFWQDHFLAKIREKCIIIETMDSFPKIFHMQEDGEQKSIVCNDIPKTFQLITSTCTIYQSIQHIFDKFDLQNCKIAYSGGVFYADKSFMEYLETGIINVMPNPSELTKNRIDKYTRDYNSFQYAGKTKIEVFFDEYPATSMSSHRVLSFNSNYGRRVSDIVDDDVADIEQFVKIAAFKIQENEA